MGKHKDYILDCKGNRLEDRDIVDVELDKKSWTLVLFDTGKKWKLDGACMDVDEDFIRKHHVEKSERYGNRNLIVTKKGNFVCSKCESDYGGCGHSFSFCYYNLHFYNDRTVMQCITEECPYYVEHMLHVFNNKERKK